MKEYKDVPWRMYRCEHSGGKWYGPCFDLDTGDAVDPHDCSKWDDRSSVQMIKDWWNNLRTR